MSLLILVLRRLSDQVSELDGLDHDEGDNELQCQLLLRSLREIPGFHTPYPHILCTWLCGLHFNFTIEVLGHYYCTENVQIFDS